MQNSILSPVLKNNRIAGAQLIGIIGMIFTYPIVLSAILPVLGLFLIPILDTNINFKSNHLLPWCECQSIWLLFYSFFLLPIGALIAICQLTLLYKWIKRYVLWTICYSMVTALLILIMALGWGSFTDLFTPNKGQVFIRILDGDIRAYLYIFFALPIGLVGGLLIGMVQSIWLTAGKKNYIVLNSIAWSVTFPVLILLFAFSLIIIKEFP